MLSIITVNLNNAAGLEKTLQSIFGQSVKNYEVIVIDGNSTDESPNIIRNFSDRIAYWVSEPDSGIYNAMNKGISHSHGDYCFFLNSGDFFVNEKVLENLNTERFTDDIVFGNLIVTSKNKIEGIIKGKENITFLDIYSSNIKHQASFIRKELFSRFGYYDETLKISADWAFFIKTVGLNNASIRYIDLDIAYFDNDGISNKNPELCRIENEEIIKRYIPDNMKEDYRLLKKYKSIINIDRKRFGWFLFRILAKTVKVLSYRA